MGNILINAYTNQNLGDDLFLETLISRFPSKNFIVVGKEEKLEFLTSRENVKVIDVTVANFFDKLFLKLNILSHSDFKLSKWKKFLKRNSIDISCYMILGGSMFMERGKLDFRTSNLIVSELSNASKLVIGSNFGPYETPSFYEFHKNYFKKFDLIIFRDSASKAYFPNFRNVIFSTDFVFNLSNKWQNELKEKNSVGISVIRLDNREHLKKYKDTYLSYLDGLIKSSLQQNRNCYLFSFCEAEGDNLVVNYFLEKYKEVIPVYYKGNLDEFLKIYSKVETIIATRFHALVLSLLFKQNVLSLIYSDKTYNLIKDLGVPINYKYIKDLNSNEQLPFDLLHPSDITDIKKEAAVYFSELDKYL